MGRAIVREPQVFLMDEPLSNLDAKLRVQTRTQIAALQRRLGVTTVYVTHDQVEAMTMGDRVAVLDRGRAAAVRHAEGAVHPAGQPVRRRVHRFAGDEPAPGARRRTGGRPRYAVGTTRPDQLAAPHVRSGHDRRAPRGLADQRGERARRDRSGRRGARVGGVPLLHRGRTATRRSSRAPRASARRSPGDRIRLPPVPSAVHLFDSATGARLPD